MAKQKRLSFFVKSKGRDFKGKFPPQYKAIKFVYVEDKYDGLRCIVVFSRDKAKAYTSTGVLIPNAAELCTMIEKKLKGQEDRVFDGEMYCTNWNDTVSVMKTQTYNKELASKANLRFFDTMLLSEYKAQKCDTPLQIRKRILAHKLKFIASNRLQLIPHRCVRPKIKLMDKLMKDADRRGLEGIMIKDPFAGYAFRTGSANWLKHKLKKDADLKILDALPGDKGKRNEKRLGRLKLKGVIDGKKILTKCGGGFTDKNRDELWALHKKGKLVGRFAIFNHEGTTVNGALRFPQFVKLHEEK